MPPLNQLVQLRRDSVQIKKVTKVTSEEVQASYSIEGLRPHEFPVVGLVVHPRILPGFCYRVRPLSTNKYLFEGRALHLLSIGQGYGKRITFRADEGEKNGNKNFFWSDSRPEGFGFELEVVSPGDKFKMFDATRKKIGCCEVIANKDPQKEQSHLMWPDGTIEKWVVVKLKCKINWISGSVSTGCISGNAIASKASRGASAQLVRIINCKMDTHKNTMTLMPGADKQKRRITVTGVSGSDIPVTYTISGLTQNEFPIIGTFVDSRVLPGFHYIVRPSQAKNPLFSGKSMRLLSIGRGYGKRFTFESSCRNQNDHYFWSDSYPEGFGFGPHEVLPGMAFKIYAGDDEIGTATVKRSAKPQVEIEMVLLPNGGVLKRLRIDIICHIEIGTSVTRACRVVGTAVVIRPGSNGSARVEKIEAPGLDSPLIRNIPGELTFIANTHQPAISR